MENRNQNEEVPEAPKGEEMRGYAELFNIVRYNVWDYLHDVIGLDEVHETILASMEQHSRDRRLCIRKCANTVLAVFRQIVDDADGDFQYRVMILLEGISRDRAALFMDFCFYNVPESISHIFQESERKARESNEWHSFLRIRALMSCSIRDAYQLDVTQHLDSDEETTGSCRGWKFTDNNIIKQMRVHTKLHLESFNNDLLNDCRRNCWYCNGYDLKWSSKSLYKVVVQSDVIQLHNKPSKKRSVNFNPVMSRNDARKRSTVEASSNMNKENMGGEVTYKENRKTEGRASYIRGRRNARVLTDRNAMNGFRRGGQRTAILLTDPLPPPPKYKR